jgi:site-specific recombinase XerD
MVKNNARNQLQATILKIEGAYAPSTIRAYRANFIRFIEYCESMKKSPLPANPIEVASYIVHLMNSGLKSASIRIAIASISSIHKLNSFDDPTLHPDVKIELKRMHRKLGRLSKQSFGITKPILEKMINTTRDDLHGLRDKALILIAYDSLCRRTELTSIKIEDIIRDEKNSPSRIRLRRSKTDQEAIGKIIGINATTQSALNNWIDAANIADGFLFRGIKNNGQICESLNPGQINRIYKKMAIATQIPKEQISNISGHSFRVGAAQDLVRIGASLPVLMNRGRWSKPDTAMRYAEALELQKTNI